VQSGLLNWVKSEREQQWIIPGRSLLLY